MIATTFHGAHGWYVTRDSVVVGQWQTRAGAEAQAERLRERLLPTVYQAPLASLQFCLDRVDRARAGVERCRQFSECFPADTSWLERVAAWQRSVTFWRRAAAQELTRLA